MPKKQRESPLIDKNVGKFPYLDKISPYKLRLKLPHLRLTPDYYIT